jgi:hypothetical protein
VEPYTSGFFLFKKNIPLMFVNLKMFVRFPHKDCCLLAINKQLKLLYQTRKNMPWEIGLRYQKLKILANSA